MKTKTYDYKKNAKYRIILGSIVFVIGILIQLFTNITYTIGTITLGSWLTGVGIILIAIGTKHHFNGGILIIDERYQKVINKASSITFATIIYGCLVVFLITTIKPIQVDLGHVTSFILFATIIIYRASIWYYNKNY